MALIQVPDRVIQSNWKPDYPVEINPEHPRAGDLIAACLHNEKNGIKVWNLANGTVGNFQSSTAVTRDIESNGRTINFTTASTLGYYPATITPTATYTIMALVTFKLGGSIQSFIDDDNHPSTPRVFQFRQNVSNQVEFIAFNTAGTAYTLDAPGAITFNKPTWCVATLSGLNQAVWMNKAKTTGVITGSPQSTDSVLWCGVSKVSGGTQSLTGSISHWMMFDALLSDAEIENIQDRPFQIYRPKSRDIWVSVAGSSGSALSGTGTAIADGSATASVAIPIVSASIATSSGTATISQAIPFTAASTATATGSGNLTESVAAAGTGTTSGAGAATISQAISIASNATATATASGNLQLAISMTSSAVATATGSATMATNGALQGTGTATGTGSGTMGMSIALSASAIAQAIGSGSLGISGSFQGTGTATGTGSATMGQAIPMLSASLASVSGTGTMVQIVPLQSAAVVNASGSGIVALQISMDAAAMAAAAGLGNLSLVVQMNANTVAQAIGSGYLSTGTALIPIPRYTVNAIGRTFSASAKGRTFTINALGRSFTL